MLTVFLPRDPGSADETKAAPVRGATLGRWNPLRAAGVGIAATMLASPPWALPAEQAASETVEVSYKGEYRFHTRSSENKTSDTERFKILFIDSTVTGVAEEDLKAVKSTLRKWLETKEGFLQLDFAPGTIMNQEHGGSNTEVYCDSQTIAKVTLPDEMVFASQTSIEANPAKSWKKITEASYDETAGESADPRIVIGPADPPVTTIVKPGGVTAPEVGLWIKAATTPTSTTAQARFRWSSENGFAVTMNVTSGVAKVVQTGVTHVVKFQCAPVDVSCDLHSRHDTVLQHRKDRWERHLGKNGAVIKDWHLVKEGAWENSPEKKPTRVG